uniref:Uncharacterized protein n=1 Tax=Schlesneria paludicola TaxID=360056 RepID=A0A7C4QQX0_9PLAN
MVAEKARLIDGTTAAPIAAAAPMVEDEDVVPQISLLEDRQRYLGVWREGVRKAGTGATAGDVVPVPVCPQ